MKRNEDDPDYLEGLGDLLPAETLKKLNELLEQLHQSNDNNHQGSNNTFVYVASGAQYVNNQYQQTPLPNPPQRKTAEVAGGLSDALATEEAMALWQKAREAGYVDEHYQPKISRTQSALLADAMAERLGIRNKWKAFEKLWNRTKMYKDYYEAVEQKQYLPFLDKLKQIFC